MVKSWWISHQDRQGFLHLSEEALLAVVRGMEGKRAARHAAATLGENYPNRFLLVGNDWDEESRNAGFGGLLVFLATSERTSQPLSEKGWITLLNSIPSDQAVTTSFNYIQLREPAQFLLILNPAVFEWQRRRLADYFLNNLKSLNKSERKASLVAPLDAIKTALASPDQRISLAAFELLLINVSEDSIEEILRIGQSHKNPFVKVRAKKWLENLGSEPEALGLVVAVACKAAAFRSDAEESL